MHKKYDTIGFIQKSTLIHGDKYNYSLVNFSHTKTPVEIICKTHGSFFQTPNKHLAGQGCKKCSGLEKLDLNEFIKRVNSVHNNYYIYDKTNYINIRTKVLITCPIHGDFFQNPQKHISGQGCTSCNKSKAQNKIFLILNNLNENFIVEHKFDKCVNPKTNRRLPFDFYLSKYNLCIEYDGEQHYRPFSKFGGDKTFIETQERDKIKNKFCKENKIILKRIHYKDFDNLDKMIKSLINSLQLRF